MIELSAIAIVIIWLAFLSFLAFMRLKRTSDSSPTQPMVSIMIALRNEENNVQTLCASLSQLTYPIEKFEILLGDDDSNDNTLELLRKYKPENAQVFPFQKEQTGAYGKQKVLGKLVQNAVGDYFLFTDADMTFPPNWIQGMLKHHSDCDSVVVGFTQVSGKSWFASMQNMDWLFNEWIIAVFAKFGLYLTAWGNNLLVSKEAYEKSGGHMNLKQSIVEDVALLRGFTSNGGKLTLNADPDAVATTNAIESLRDLMHQRKRWMAGLSGWWPFFALAGLLKMLFWPSVVFLAYNNIIWLVPALICFVLKWMVLRNTSKITKAKFDVAQLLAFEIYDFVIYLLTFAFYLLPIRMVWKDRKY